MKRLDELPESERAVLQQLSLGPASVQVISDNTGQADSAVWFLLARLQEAGFVRSDWTGGGVARPPRIYSLTAAGQRTVEGD
jgi:predicted ArsR family transcriptional regulator